MIYSSEATSGVGSEQIEALISAARIKNARLGITGVLVYADNLFIQVLEGQRSIVEEMLATVASDARNRDLTVFHRIHDTEQMFTHWKMALVDTHDPATVRMLGHTDTQTLSELGAELGGAPPARVPRLLYRIVAALDSATAKRPP
ncbi:MAG: BLUF domain-containing protein [Gammaproteobacteria bacterium]|nr:BLUF domain-containing protein [Gammaproteobacteria bacterium]